MSAPVRHKILLLILALGWLALLTVAVGWLVAPLGDVVRALASILLVGGAVGVGAMAVLLVLRYVFRGAIEADRQAEDTARRAGSSCSRCL